MDRMVDFMLCVFYHLCTEDLKTLFFFFSFAFFLLFLILPARDLLRCSQPLNVAGSAERLTA